MGLETACPIEEWEIANKSSHKTHADAQVRRLLGAVARSEATSYTGSERTCLDRRSRAVGHRRTGRWHWGQTSDSAYRIRLEYVVD